MRILPRDMRPHVRLEDIVIQHKAIADLTPGQAVLQFIEVLKVNNLTHFWKILPFAFLLYEVVFWSITQ